MARNKEKIKMNKVREKIAGDYRGRLREQDETIRVLTAQNETLRKTEHELRQQLDERDAELRVMREWLERMQDYVNLSDTEMDEVRRSLASSKESREALERLGGLLNIMGAVTRYM